ncbi:MAG TPA: amidase [Solirubrobacteraceae bacterium]|nr:amidase [Solirubrobacteraceae bacterium]
MDPPLTITSAASALRAGSVSSVELVADAFARADRLDEPLGVYIARFDETALDAARTADRERAAGVDRGPLHGIPIGVKDLIATREGPTTGNSRVDYPQWRRPRDAPVVARLRAAGAVITGKVTLMEFALGIHDDEKGFPMPRNPWSPAHWPGGSSGGSGAGVPAGMFLGALGSDTGGSVRLPASYCGISGLKQTFGRVPKSDVIPAGASLDLVGPMARSAADCAAMLQVMAGHDPADPTSAREPVPDFSTRLGAHLGGMRIGVDRRNHLYGAHVQRELPRVFEAAVDELGQLGATLVEVELPHYRELVGATLITFFTEALAYHRRALREQWDAFGAGARLAMASNACFTADDYIAAQKARTVVRARVDQMFDRVDLVVSPSTSTSAPLVDGFDLAGLQATLYTIYWSGAGNPAISIPMGTDDVGLPFGLQIAGRPFDEAAVVHAADAYQRVTDWHLRAMPEELARV